MKKILTYLGLGLVSFTTVVSCCYYFYNKKEKSHLQLLIEGNERYMKKNMKLFKPSLNNILVLNLNKHLDPRKIFDTNCNVEHILNAEDLLSNDFEFISNILLDKKIETLVVLDDKENDFKAKNFLIFLTQNENIRKYINGRITSYWSTFDKSNDYVAFRRLL